MSKLEPPTLTVNDPEIRPGYRVPQSVDIAIARIAHQTGQSKNAVVASFLLWAVKAYEQGHTP